jgi:oxygen-independent coproporphyrinogen-3 oxidase
MNSTMSLPVVAPLISRLENDPYEGYSYSYPHKSAYGPFTPPVPLRPLWQTQDRQALFLYVHIPFCEMRCGFCNLFARAGVDEERVDAYLGALERQAAVMSDATATARRVARLAVGGGTPTFLSPPQLDRVFTMLDRQFDVQPRTIPSSVETSPKTATRDRLLVLRSHGVQRVSMGVQSFVEKETHAIGRPQIEREVHAALQLLRDFPVLNIDLIYGQPNQTVASWLISLRAALEHRPDEIYLYPLYVRPNTGIGRRGTVERAPGHFLRSLYREARDYLVAEGYEQVSMRFFQRKNSSLESGPVYCCQTDGMLGLGCGARSYTSYLHYSSRFAVEADGVESILNEWEGQSIDDFAEAKWGVRLSEDDRRRRFVIQSLLTRAGLMEADYNRLFGVPVTNAFPLVTQLGENGLAECTDGTWRLTALGMELSDAIGPTLYSEDNRALLKAFAHP